MKVQQASYNEALKKATNEGNALLEEFYKSIKSGTLARYKKGNECKYGILVIEDKFRVWFYHIDDVSSVTRPSLCDLSLVSRLDLVSEEEFIDGLKAKVLKTAGGQLR